MIVNMVISNLEGNQYDTLIVHTLISLIWWERERERERERLALKHRGLATGNCFFALFK